MADQRVQKLARNLINHSLKVQPGEKVLIETRGIDAAFISALVQETYAAKGLPFVNLKLPEIDRELIRGCTEEQLQMMYRWEEERMLAMDCYIGIRMPGNAYEESGVPFAQTQLYNNVYDRRLTTEVRCPKTRWVALRYPTPALAQAAQMSTRDFEDFYFDACTLDYDRLSRAMDPLAALMARTDKVRITARDTDLTFSIKGIGSVKIRNLAMCNFDTPHLKQMIDAGLPVVSNQTQYSVFDRRPERALLQYSREHDVFSFCYGTLSGGFLAERWLGVKREELTAETRSHVKYLQIIEDSMGWDGYQQMLALLKEIAEAHGTTIACVATRFILNQPGVGAPWSAHATASMWTTTPALPPWS